MYIKQLINCNKKENLKRLNERDNFKVFTRLVEDLLFMYVTNTVRIVLFLLSCAKSRFLSTIIMRSARWGVAG